MAAALFEGDIKPTYKCGYREHCADTSGSGYKFFFLENLVEHATKKHPLFPLKYAVRISVDGEYYLQEWEDVLPGIVNLVVKDGQILMPTMDAPEGEKQEVLNEHFRDGSTGRTKKRSVACRRNADN